MSRFILNYMPGMHIAKSAIDQSFIDKPKLFDGRIWIATCRYQIETDGMWWLYQGLSTPVSMESILKQR